MNFPVCSLCQRLGVYQHLPSKAPQYDISSEGEGRSDEIPIEVSLSDHSARACRLVLRHSVSVGQNSSSNPESPGSTRYSQEWHREERSTNFGCYSVEPASGNCVCGTESSGGLSETPASGNRGHVQKIFDEEWWPDEGELNTVTIGNMSIDNKPC